MSCADCNFLESDGVQNVCVRFPPTPAMIMSKGALGQPVPTIIAMRPQVQLEWDCGEWEASGEADDKPETSTKQGVIIQ